MNRPTPLCIEVLSGPDKGRVVGLDARTYRLGKDLRVAGISEAVDLTARQSGVDVDRQGESRVWLPHEVLVLDGIHLRLVNRHELTQPDVETNLPAFDAFASQLEELLSDVMGPRGYELFVFVLNLKNLKSLRDTDGLPATAELLMKLSKRLHQIEGITHLGRTQDDEIVMVCARPVVGFVTLYENILGTVSASAPGLVVRLGSRTVSPHPHLLSSLLIESARPTEPVTPRTHRPVPERH